MNIQDITDIKLHTKNDHEELWTFSELDIPYNYYTRAAYHTELKYQGDLVQSFIPITYITKAKEMGCILSSVRYLPLDESNPIQGIRKFLQLMMLT